jgi:hypothetical protein
LQPAKEPYQNQHYSAKKKQHTLNMLVIVLLSGEIIALSPIVTGSCNQTIWNDQEFRKCSENKEYRILGDGVEIDTFEITSAKLVWLDKPKDQEKTIFCSQLETL